MPGKIKIAILWHMHQPFYIDPFTQKMELPWVRLHGLKDYYGMAALLEDFPGVKATYNLVPSLLTQLERYTGGERDVFQDMFAKDARTLQVEEINFLMRHFFSANHQNLIKPWPRYQALADKKNRHQHASPGDWGKIFSIDELRDLQVWFQLCYFDEQYKENDERVKALIKKGENFSEADKKIVAEVEMELLGKIIPQYKTLSGSGQVELSTSPFYHPILPLLMDPQEGRAANPSLPEYDLHFNWKEDARYQLEAALAYMKETFGKPPAGIWPSEGSLSRDVLGLLDELGIQWTAGDETVLSRSLGIPIERDSHFTVQNPGVLYRPYVLKDSDIKIKIFFRDRHLSDLIGFHYRKMPYQKAAADLVHRIKQAGSRLHAAAEHDIVVPIILDGENAWEYFANSGRDFLREFFQRVSEDKTLETVTFSEVLGMEPGVIDHFRSGSWINGNFDIWIGDEEDRKGWKLLAKTKTAVAEAERSTGLSGPQRKEIREYLAIAQGSDWFWWFGTENYTPDIDIFDGLFRKNLQKVYALLGLEIPLEFLLPVSGASLGRGIRVIPPGRPITPRVDGRVGNYFEWYHAGRMDVSAAGGAMNIINPLVSMLYYGFDEHRFYLRIDTKKPAAGYFETGYTLDIVIKEDHRQESIRIDSSSNPAPGIETAVDSIIEMAALLETLHLKEGDSFYLQLEWKLKGDYFQVIPFHDYLCLQVPTALDYAYSWQV